MATKKITELTNLATPVGADVLPIVDDVAGTPTTKKVTATNLMTLAPVQSVNAGQTGTVTLSNTDISGLGTAATQDVGTSNGNVVQLDSTGLPAVDGSQLTNLPSSSFFYSTVSDSTTARTLSNSDNGKVIVFSNSSAVTVSIPDGLTSGFGCTIVQGGNGRVTINASGTASVNAYNAGSGALNTTVGQHAALQVIPTGSDAYILSGDGGLPPFLNTYSLEFDGTNDFMTPNSSISVTGAKTVTFWCYPHDFTNRCVLAGGGGATYWFFWGSSSAGYIVSASTPIRNGGSNVVWSANQWYHIAIVDDGAGTITPYINSAAQDTMSISGKNFAISTIANLTSHYYDGILDEMGFWNSALGSAEIVEIYGSSGNREFDLTADSGN